MSDSAVVKAIVATAALTLVFSGICFLFFHRIAMARRKKRVDTSFCRETDSGPEGGLKFIYLSKVAGEQVETAFSKVMLNPSFEEDEEKGMISSQEVAIMHKPPHVPEVPLLHEASVVCSDEMLAFDNEIPSPVSLPTPQRTPPLPPRPLPSPLIYSQPPCQLLPRSQPSLPQHQSLLPHPSDCPPPEPMNLEKQTEVPVRLQLVHQPKKVNVPPPPPLPPPPSKPLPMFIRAKRSPMQQSPPGDAGGLDSSVKSSPGRKGKEDNRRRINTSSGSSQRKAPSRMKLKPLHWEKVTTTTDQSVVWDDINDGSFRFDDDLMVDLFGYAPTYSSQSPERNISSSVLSKSSTSLSTQVFLLEPRKSQNTAIVLRSLGIAREELLEALLDGQGLGAEALEKLVKVSPTEEEETRILEFSGSPEKLADAESFLYKILTAVPSAFSRMKAMLFRANYDTEVLHLKESLQTLELGCKEIRACRLFLKLLEAILKAGNRMNAGTARGNAQGFNLTALQKLSDVKSTDRNITLLHFVVEQVARSEGRRCVLKANSSEKALVSESNPENLGAEERDRECIGLGITVIAKLNTELLNVKRAATLEYGSFINLNSILGDTVAEIQQLVQCCSGDKNGGRFVGEMKGFLDECEEELKVVREEQTRVMELVKRTTEYFQAEASKDKAAQSLQLFTIVKDFLEMVNQVCSDIKRNLQKKQMRVNAGSPPPFSQLDKSSVQILGFQLPLKPGASEESNSKSNDDF